MKNRSNNINELNIRNGIDSSNNDLVLTKIVSKTYRNVKIGAP